MHRRVVAILSLAFAFLAGCSRQADVAKPQHFAEHGIAFDYPGNWRITKNEAEVTGRIIFVEDSGSTFVAFTVFEHGLDVNLKDYVEDFRKRVGESVPFNLVKRSTLEARTEGIDCKFSLQLLGVNVPHTANFTKHVFGATSVICLTQVADEDRHFADPGFALIRRSLAPAKSDK